MFESYSVIYVMLLFRIERICTIHYSVEADVVAHVLESMKSDLKDRLGKDMFIHYRATSVLIQFFKPANQVCVS